jgi:predicted AlkP superfamily pyrophosphatase or phosphodiesterase
MLDRATLDVALLAMEAEGIGQSKGRTDFLSVSFSQTDRVGHPYGPLSREQMDNLLRLDGVIEEFFSALDRDVGRENYVLAFTSDHGVMDNPERIPEGGLRLTNEHRATLERALSAAAREAGSDPSLGVSEAMVRTMTDLPFVGPAYSHETLMNGGEEGDSLFHLFQHSMTPGRPGGLLSTYGVEMWWTENTLPWGLPVGTTHGSPYYYDRWVPMILMGPGIEAGTVTEPVRPMDLAPTLAAMLGIPFPDDLDGKPLSIPEAQESLVR